MPNWAYWLAVILGVLYFGIGLYGNVSFSGRCEEAGGVAVRGTTSELVCIQKWNVLKI